MNTSDIAFGTLDLFNTTYNPTKNFLKDLDLGLLVDNIPVSHEELETPLFKLVITSPYQRDTIHVESQIMKSRTKKYEPSNLDILSVLNLTVGIELPSSQLLVITPRGISTQQSSQDIEQPTMNYIQIPQ